MIQFGYAREDITPARGIGLCGYFEPRPNKGMRDQLNIRAAIFSDGKTVSGIIERTNDNTSSIEISLFFIINFLLI